MKSKSKWEHQLYEGFFILNNPTTSENIKDVNSLIQYRYPSEYQPPSNSHLFIYPELPELRFYPMQFVIVFSTPTGTQYGHVLRTETMSMCLVSYYCWDDFYKSVVNKADDYYEEGTIEKFPEFLNKLVYPPCTINKIYNMKVSALIEKLTLNQIIIMINSILCERRVIFVCSNYWSLTTFILATLQLLYPLEWPHPIVTLLPVCYHDIVDLPTPFICGMTSEHFMSFEGFTNKVVVVNLDEGKIHSNDSKMIQEDAQLLPEISETFLRTEMKPVFTKSPSEIPFAIEKVFQKFMDKLLQSPGEFIEIKKIKGNITATMDMEKYKKTYDYKTGNRKVCC